MNCLRHRATTEFNELIKIMMSSARQVKEKQSITTSLDDIIYGRDAAGNKKERSNRTSLTDRVRQKCRRMLYTASTVGVT